MKSGPTGSTTGTKEYAHRLFQNILDWYKNADLKAQAILTLDAVFISFLAGTAYANSSDLKDIIFFFGFETWLFLGLMAASLLASIATAIMCFKSRLDDPEDINQHLQALDSNVSHDLQQKPETMWFFGHIAHLKNRERFQKRFLEFTEEDEILAMSSQIFLLSKNVLQKHLWVNRSFLLAGLTFALFLGATVSYLLHIVFSEALSR